MHAGQFIKVSRGDEALKKKFIDRISGVIVSLTIFLFLNGTLVGNDFLAAPSAYKGRFRPMEVYAKLWLNEFYHQQAVRKEHAHLFISSNRSAANLLLKMNFFGHEPWDDAPLFWIHFAETKALLGMDLHQDRFSYNRLHEAMVKNTETNLKFVQNLALYHYFKSLKNSSQPLQKIELTSLTPGLWLTISRNQILVAAAPKHAPWENLKPGMVLPLSSRENGENFVSKHRLAMEEAQGILSSLRQYLQIQNPDHLNMHVKQALLDMRHLPPKDISLTLENAYPLKERLNKAGPLLHLLPGKSANGEWLPLNALEIQIYDAKQQDFIPAGNFTLYPDKQFDEIRRQYFELKEAVLSNAAENQIQQKADRLGALLIAEYRPFANTTYEKGLIYPSLMQIGLEQIYYRYPFIPLAILLYACGCFSLSLGWRQESKAWKLWGMRFIYTAFGLHTLILAMRCFILQRPPVSNMFETVVYVPWIAMTIGIFMQLILKSRAILFASSFASLILLALLQAADIDPHLENVQAVLNSQYWLIIHVMLVVGSYGAFVLSGILGHAYLIGASVSQETVLKTPKLILQTMYIGVAMLVAGTLLGGVWAAESWGRFWDWDPKESWAFISICIYLIWIHAYNFRFIHDFGLAVGSIIGLAAISFTWYGVNYILGTGLHSYGFGNGGEIYYYLYLLAEALFLAGAYKLIAKIFI